MMSPVPIEDQAKLLDEVLNVVKVQAHLMKKCLVCILAREITIINIITKGKCLSTKFYYRKIINLWTV